jgi:hypothetical protein
MEYKLFLDDVREIRQVFDIADLSGWLVVKNYQEFVKAIEDNGMPTFISFDHDLADEHYRPSMYNSDGHYSAYYSDGTFKEKTGYDCAKWLIEYCINKNVGLPTCNVHSANPIGRKNIISILQSYERSRRN